SLDVGVDGDASSDAWALPDATPDEGGDSESEADVSADDAADGADAPVEAAAPACDDGIKNGDESDTDCGESCAPDRLGGRGSHCVRDADCASAVCDANVCASPSCSDHTKNGNETAIDCGGSCAPAERCADGQACAIDGDCESGVC